MSELSTPATRAQLQLAAAVRDVSSAEWRQVRAFVDWLTSRQGGTTSRCESCGAYVVWGRTVRGKLMPVNPLPHPRGNVTLERTNAGGLLVTVHRNSALPLPGRSYRAHFATCPQARGDELAPKLPAGERCEICDRQLHPVLIAAGERTHGERLGELARQLCTQCGYVLDPRLVERGHTTHLEGP